MGSPEQDGQILRHLADIKRQLDSFATATRDVANTQVRIESAVNQVQQDVSDLAAETRLARSRLDRHGRRLRSLENGASVEVDPMEITSTHDIREIRLQDPKTHETIGAIRERVDHLTSVEKRRDSFTTFLKKQWALLAFSLVAVTVGGCGTVGFEIFKAYVLKK